MHGKAGFGGGPNGRRREGVCMNDKLFAEMEWPTDEAVNALRGEVLAAAGAPWRAGKGGGGKRWYSRWPCAQLRWHWAWACG